MAIKANYFIVKENLKNHVPGTKPERVSNAAKLDRYRGPGSTWLSSKGCLLFNLFQI